MTAQPLPTVKPTRRVRGKITKQVRGERRQTAGCHDCAEQWDAANALAVAATHARTAGHHTWATVHAFTVEMLPVPGAGTDGDAGQADGLEAVAAGGTR